MLLVCDDQEHGDFLMMYLVVGDEGSGAVLSLGVVCMVPFSNTRCISNLSKHNTAGGNGPEMELEWVLDGPEKGLQIGVDGLV